MRGILFRGKSFDTGKKVKRLKFIGEWIDIRDGFRRPNHGQQYFVAYVFGDSDQVFYGTAYYYGCGDNGYVKGPHFSHEGAKDMRVIYWMPIPEIPKLEVKTHE